MPQVLKTSLPSITCSTSYRTHSHLHNPSGETNTGYFGRTLTNSKKRSCVDSITNKSENTIFKLLHVYNVCNKRSCFPTPWKMAEIITITNLEKIFCSLKSTVSPLVEQNPLKKILQFRIPELFGFRVKHSPEQQALSICL